MAPIKFEEQLKDKLEQRHIKPSSDAWNKLNERLDASEEKQNNKGFWWLGIAATLVGALIAITFVFKSNTEIVEPTIVDIKKQSIIETQDVQNQDKLEEKSEVALEEADVKEINASQKATKGKVNKSLLNSMINEQQKALTTNKIKDVVAQVDTYLNLEVSDKKPVETLAEDLSFEDQKVNEVIAQLKQLHSESKTVLNDEIETLLEAAQREITMQKIIDEAIKTVDADALLRSVEDDLDQSFRNKVFNAIKSGYKTVKTAVAERNN